MKIFLHEQMHRFFGLAATMVGLVAAAMLHGCGDDQPVAPIAPPIPVGSWGSDQNFSVGGVERMRHSRLELTSQTTGTVTDSLFTRQGAGWQFDSVEIRQLQFQGVADGYQRTLEIRQPGQTTPDTTLSYRYFFRRGDSLFYYVGMRFAGANAGLQGVWSNDPADTTMLGGCLQLAFASDSVAIGSCAASAATAYSYHTTHDTLIVNGRPLYGTRYEVVPGWSLYITSRATGGYRIVK